MRPEFVVSLLLLVTSIAIPIQALGKTFVLITIDVESFANGDPQIQIFGRLPGYQGEYGISKMMDILDHAGVKGTFFLNVFEAAKFGEEPLAAAAKLIDIRGHDLGLHTHPAPMFGFTQMKGTTEHEQEAILRAGITLIRSWTGRTVISHRAGATAADVNTLVAAARVGLHVDSSMRYFTNSMKVIDGFMEIPLTVYDQLRFMSWRSSRNLDIEASSADEISRVIEGAATHGLCTVTLLMHSFSFVRDNQPDLRLIQRLETVLKSNSFSPDISFSTVSDFYYRYGDGSAACSAEAAFIPETGFVLTYKRSVENLTHGWKNVLLVIGLPLFALMIAILGYFLLRKRGCGERVASSR